MVCLPLRFDDAKHEKLTQTQGCCTSREASSPPSRAVTGTGTDASSRNNSTADDIATPSGPSILAAANPLHITSGHRTGSLVRRPNAPLRRAKAWRSTSRSWTTGQLARERNIFFETQVTGRREVWSAVQLATEMVRESGDLAGAKAVLDASGCTCPTGRLAEGVWDERGELYKMPKWVVSDPVNVVEGGTGLDGADDGRAGAGDEDEQDDDDDDDDDEVAKDGTTTQDEKPGDPQPGDANAITFKARLSDRATDVEITAFGDAPVKSLIKKIRAKAQVCLCLTTAKIKLTRDTHRSQARPRFDWRTWARCSKRARRSNSRAGSRATF